MEMSWECAAGGPGGPGPDRRWLEMSAFIPSIQWGGCDAMRARARRPRIDALAALKSPLRWPREPNRRSSGTSENQQRHRRDAPGSTAADDQRTSPREPQGRSIKSASSCEHQRRCRLDAPGGNAADHRRRSISTAASRRIKAFRESPLTSLTISAPFRGSLRSLRRTSPPLPLTAPQKCQLTTARPRARGDDRTRPLSTNWQGHFPDKVVMISARRTAPLRRVAFPPMTACQPTTARARRCSSSRCWSNRRHGTTACSRAAASSNDRCRSNGREGFALLPPPSPSCPLVRSPPFPRCLSVSVCLSVCLSI